jgi:hypothetical protein
MAAACGPFEAGTRVFLPGVGEGKPLACGASGAGRCIQDPVADIAHGHRLEASHATQRAAVRSSLSGRSCSLFFCRSRWRVSDDGRVRLLRQRRGRRVLLLRVCGGGSGVGDRVAAPQAALPALCRGQSGTRPFLCALRNPAGALTARGDGSRDGSDTTANTATRRFPGNDGSSQQIESVNQTTTLLLMYRPGAARWPGIVGNGVNTRTPAAGRGRLAGADATVCHDARLF